MVKQFWRTTHAVAYILLSWLRKLDYGGSVNKIQQ